MNANLFVAVSARLADFPHDGQRGAVLWRKKPPGWDVAEQCCMEVGTSLLLMLLCQERGLGCTGEPRWLAQIGQRDIPYHMTPRRTTKIGNPAETKGTNGSSCFLGMGWASVSGWQLCCASFVLKKYIITIIFP